MGFNIYGDLGAVSDKALPAWVAPLKIVMFNINALPAPDGGNVINYLGTGSPIVRLVN